MEFDSPTSCIIVDAEVVVDDALGCLEATVTVIEGDPHAVIAESDDVRSSVTCEVGEEPRMHVYAPLACIIVEAEVVVDDVIGCLEATVTVIDGDSYGIIAESDDVCPSVTCEVREEPRIPIYAPSAWITIVEAELVDDLLGCLEATVTVIEGDPDAVIAESDDVCSSVACEVGEEPRMQVYAPAASSTCNMVKAEVVVDDALGCLEATVTVIEGDPHAVIAESDDVCSSVACEVGEEPRMAAYAPTSCIIVEAEAVVDDSLGCLGSYRHHY